MTDDGYSVNGNGGGLSADMWGLNDPTIISGNIFSNNVSGGYGGGIFLQAYGEKFTITNNQLTGNTATRSGGGATILSESYQGGNIIDFINNTVAGNQAGSQGGGLNLLMFSDKVTANLYNNIFWTNSSTNPGRDLYLDNDFDDNYLPGVCNLHNNNFNQSGWGIYMDIPFPIPSNNLNWKDPLFAGQWQDNYMLSKTSPCLNKGNNNAPNLPSTDLKGKPRIQDGVVDMGAYEGVSELLAKPVLTPVMMLLLHND
jgi:hypothetical protein